MSLQSEALRSYFSSRAIQQSEVAEKMECSPQMVSNILAGREKIGAKRAKKFNEVYGFDIPFLITGEGTLLPPAGYRRVESSPNSTITMGDHSPIHLVENDLLRRENDLLRQQNDALRQDAAALRDVIAQLTKNLQLTCKEK